MIRVFMQPAITDFRGTGGALASGIGAVVQAYTRYLPDYGIQLLDRPDHADLIACHVHARGGRPVDVLHNHGLIWGGQSGGMNAEIAAAARQALAITVPSRWVAWAFERGMHLTPRIVPHGIEFADWPPGGADRGDSRGYVLWNKNRADSVCDPRWGMELARLFPAVRFVSTFAPAGAPTPPNLRVVGLQPHREMARMVAGAGVYLATTQETFGIGTLEAMACGIPVLGFAHGAITDMVAHQETGWLAQPGDIRGLAEGLAYCFVNRERLGAAARESARRYTWQNAVGEIARLYGEVKETGGWAGGAPTYAIVIPCYNKAGMVAGAMASAVRQSIPPAEVIVIDDGSTDSSLSAATGAAKRLGAAARATKITVEPQPNGGVAAARNLGIELCAAAGHKYVCFLDADDELEPGFAESCVVPMERDRTLGGAYTGLLLVNRQASITRVSQWPVPCDPVKQAAGFNQVPTCCMLRLAAIRRAGGFRSMYCPTGAGSEDANLWLRMMLMGWRFEMTSPAPLFRYTVGTGATAKPGYFEVPWRWWHDAAPPPFASATLPPGAEADIIALDRPELIIVVKWQGARPATAARSAISRHEQLRNTLASIEGQDYRHWRVIVRSAHQGKSLEVPRLIREEFPFCEFAGPAIDTTTPGKWLVVSAGEWFPPGALAGVVSNWPRNAALAWWLGGRCWYPPRQDTPLIRADV